MVIFAGENLEQFQLLLESYVEKFEPVDEIEMALVEQMAIAEWRQQRSWGLETEMVNSHVAQARAQTATGRLAEAFTDLASAPGLALLHRYESRHSRMYVRALQNLLLIRKSCKSKDLQSEGEAGQVTDVELPNER